MRKSKDLIVFEIAAYIVEDGINALHYLVEQGRKKRQSALSKQFRISYHGRMLCLEDKILEELVWDAQWIHIQLKIKPRLIKRLKELDALNKEAQK